jgi:hypothetical protein
MAQIRDTEKGLRGTALSSLGASLYAILGRLPHGNQPGHKEAADIGKCFRRW